MPTKNNYFNILIKPCSSDCNLHCDYCFYLKKSKLYPGSNIHKMSSNILERLISTYLNTEQQHYVFLWQGGEPLLMGLDFFKNAINLQQKYGKPGTLITNIIQTNGTLINDDWCKFFNEYKFLVGISIDGPKNLHDIYRKNGDRGSHSTVIKSIRCLQKNQVDLFHSPYFVAPLFATQPSIITVHDLIFDRYPDYMPMSWSRPYYRLLMKMSTRRAERVVAVSRATARDLNVHTVPEA